MFALGQHHNPPFVASSPPTTLAYIAALTERIILSTATTLITTTDPVRIAEDYAQLQHLAEGRLDLTLGRGNTGPVYSWFGQDAHQGVPLAIENYALLHRLWLRAHRRLGRRVPHSAAAVHRHTPPVGRRAAVRVAWLRVITGDGRTSCSIWGRILRPPHLLARVAHEADGQHLPPTIRGTRTRCRGPRHRRSRRASIHQQAKPGCHETVPSLLRQRTPLRQRAVPRGLHGPNSARLWGRRKR